MKKIKFISLNIFIIVFISAYFSFAAETKNMPKSTAPVKTATPNAAKVSAQSPGKAAPTAVSTSVKPSPASPAADVKPDSKTSPVAAAASSTPIQQPPASAAANVTPTSKATPAAAPAPVSAPSLPSQAGSYNYNPLGKPDPFKSFIVIVDKTTPKTKAAAEKKEKPLSIFPLQRAEADKYKVVGIVGNEDQRMAVAEDAAKKHYPLLIGTRIGLNDGKVVEILADRVIVEEYENHKAKRVILKLRKN